jgi:hypothetical protein
MQTQFAVIKLANTEAAARVRVYVAYADGRWAATMQQGTGRGSLLLLRTSGALEPRIAHIRNGLGTVNNRAKPFVEIAMLLKRHCQFLARTAYYDDPLDWRVEETSVLTFKEVCVASLSAYTADIWRGLLWRLYAADSAERQARWSAVFTNAIALHARPRADWPRLLTGNLLVSHTVEWRGRQFDRQYGGASYLATRDHLRQVGRLLRKSIAMSRLGENFRSEYDALVERLRYTPTTVADFSDVQRARLTLALQKIHNCTIEVADCGHFEDAASIRLVFGSAQQRWCSYCYQHHAVDVQDMRNRDGSLQRWPVSEAYYSNESGTYWSYDRDGDARSPTDSRGEEAIRSYGTNVLRVLVPDRSIKSSHFGDFLMGVELEMTAGGAQVYAAAKDVRRRLGADYCIVKADGSLPGNGFEIVTAPRGLAEHVRRISDWEISPAYRAWDTGQCGMHVHIASRAFTEMTLGKFLIFFNTHANANFIKRIAGRHPLRDDWARRYCGLEDQAILDNPKLAIKGKSPERYRIVNVLNMTVAEARRLGLRVDTSGKYDTVEVRVFKASLRKERLLAQVEFAHAAVMFCRVASYRQLTGEAFMAWLQTCTKMYPNLSDWLGARTSKQLRDLKVKSMEEACADRDSSGPIAAPAPRTTRPRRALPAGINDTILPPVPRARPRAARRTLDEIARDRF